VGGFRPRPGSRVPEAQGDGSASSEPDVRHRHRNWATLPGSPRRGAGSDALTFVVLQMRPVAGARSLDNLSVTADQRGIAPPAALAVATSSTRSTRLGRRPGAVGYHVFRDAGAVGDGRRPGDELYPTRASTGSSHLHRDLLRRPRGPSRRTRRRPPPSDTRLSIAAAGDIAWPADPNYNGGAGHSGFCQRGLRQT
jgi:hypothetical protein